MIEKLIQKLAMWAMNDMIRRAEKRGYWLDFSVKQTAIPERTDVQP